MSLLLVLFSLIFLVLCDSTTSQLIATLESSSNDHQVDLHLLNGDPSSDVALLRWNLPLDSRFGGVDPFSVYFSGQAVPYVGLRVKYAEPSQSDYLFIRSNQSLVVSVDLRDMYDMSQLGDYKVVFETTVFDFVGEPKFASIPRKRDQFVPVALLANTIVYTVSETKVPRKTPSGAVYPCSSTELAKIKAAASEFVTLVDRATTIINGGSTASYTEWFGAFDNTRWSTAKNVITKAKSNTVVAYACDSRAGVYAYVYPSDSSHTIYLCDAFWPSRVIGSFDSQSGTLLHELSHFDNIGGTDDWVYGTTGARNLAKSNPARAVNNADNFEYFAESQFI